MSPAPLPAAPEMAAPPMPAAIKVPSPMADHASPQGILSALSRTAPFSALNASQLAAVAGVVTPIKASKGTRLVAEGATPQIFVIVVQGELAVMKDSKGVGVLRPLDSFGFKNLFADCMSPVSIAVNGSTACFTLQIERAAFAKVLSANPDIAMALLPTLAAAAPDAAEVALHSGTLVTPTTASSDHLMVPSDKMPASCVPRDPTQLKIKVFDSKSYQAAFFRKLNEEKGYGYQLEFVEEKLSKDTVHMAKGAHAVCVFVHDSVDAHVAQSLVDMGIEMVAYRCAGFDMCDVKACDKLGVSVARVPAYSPYAVAEHAATLMMCLNRKIVWASSRVHNGDFSLDGLVGFDMKGKTVGVVGTGKIGACLVSIMLGFGCRVLCHDVYKNPSLLANPAVQYVEMNDLLAQADIISIHAPLMPETKHMFNAKSFAQCKRGVMIVNTSRGPLIDTKALIEALKAGQVGACGLDVVEGENDYFYENKSDQVITNDEIAHLLAFQNRVIITAHQAFLTQEALSEIAATTLKNVAEWHGGKKLKQLANSINTVMPSVAPSPAMQMVSAAPEGKKQ